MSDERDAPLSGWLLLDKPEGLRSTRAVAKARRIFGAKKAGHGGTLDPLAEGLLPIALGEATKTASFLSEASKAYRFSVRWGVGTESHDREGRVIARSPRRPAPQEIDEALRAFIGAIWQKPPSFSAIHVRGLGARAYRLARKGVAPALPPRPVHVEALRRVSSPSRDEAIFDLSCGKGFYVRALARDLGAALQIPAHVVHLRRVALGPFHEDEAVSLSALEAMAGKREKLAARLHPLRSVLGALRTVALKKTEASALSHGAALSLSPSPSFEEGERILALFSDAPIGLARFSEGRLRPTRIFEGARSLHERRDCAKEKKGLKKSP